MSTVWVFQHAPCETLGTVADVLKFAGVTARSIQIFAGEPIPSGIDSIDGLIVMGGPMGVYEHHRYPFLLEEMRAIEQALRARKSVLGICLGSQLLAATLGARVTRSTRKEIGWYPIALTESAADDPLWKDAQPTFTAFHWHGDVFELPNNAVPLARSELTACQAFRYGNNAYGFLFHMEVTEQIVREMVRALSGELYEARVDGARIVTELAAYLPRLRQIGGLVFQRWVGLLTGEFISREGCR